MGRYYFHLYDDMVVMDEEGAEFSGPSAARERAFEVARHMACAEVLEGHLSLNHRIEVADAKGKVVAVVRFRDTVEVEA